MSFGSNPITTTQSTLPNNQFPLSSVAVPNHAGGNLTALRGANASTDTNGNELADASMAIPDGNDVTQGTSTDANTANTVMGRLTKIRDLLNATLPVSLASLPTLAAGTNVIGHVIVDSAGSVSITSLPALPAGANMIGHVIIDSAGSVAITSLPTLPTGTNSIGQVTANAGTNLNTSFLALESGGNLAAAKADLDTVVTNTTGLATQTTLASVLTQVTNHAVIRSTVAVFSLASTTTSGSTQNSADLAVGPYTELSIDITTTAQAGTNPTLQYFYERKDAVNSIYYVLWQSAVLTASANTLSTSIGAGMAYNQSLGATGRLRWVIGGTATPTFTHSINVQAK